MSETDVQQSQGSASPNRKRVGVLLLLIAACLMPFLGLSEYYVHVVIMIFIYVIYTSTYRFILRTGQLHFGAHGFVGVGAYASVLMVMRLGMPFWVAMPLAGLTGGLLAVAIGYPALRVKGAYFAIITWGFAEALRFLYMRVDDPFGGNSGIAEIPRPETIPLPFLGSVNFTSLTACYFLGLALMLVTLLILYRMERSRFGLVYSSIREADDLARAVGINIMRYKVLAFAVCSGLAAIGGSFFAHYSGFISPHSFVVLLTISLGIYATVGGLESFSGPIVGTLFLFTAGEFFAQYGFYKIMLYAGLMILTILFLPAGLAGLPGVVSSAMAKLRKRGGAAAEYGAS
jgi:branched-chain amino acid transport system permease protein